MMCALRDAIARAMRESDDPLVRSAVAVLPQKLPSRFSHADRNRRLRSMAEMLRASHPGIADHAIAQLLLRAGDRIDGRNPVACSLLERLSTIECEEVTSHLVEIRSWISPNRRGVWLPQLRQLLNILRK